MKTYRITIELQSAFATPLKGDTLFGQLCWAVRNRFGEARLNDCLQGYGNGQPFAVLSDAFPKGYLPMPKLPGCYFAKIDELDRKAVKKRCWLPETAIDISLPEWLSHAIDAKSLLASTAKPCRICESDAHIATHHTSHLSDKRPQPHNSINRQTNTTGDGFAPYSIEQEWFVPGIAWSVYLLLDSTRLSSEDCQQCLADIGLFGFGRDASIGLGKFSISGVTGMVVS